MIEGQDGELIYKDDKSPLHLQTEIPRNDNALKIKQAEQAKRVAAHAAHVREVERNKIAREKQRLEKETEKQKTQKKEKRRM